MNSNDPASLQNLNDIVVPASIGWWPLASGWYVLISLLLLAFAWFGYRWVNDWFANRYRRTALLEIQKLESGLQMDASRALSLRQLPILIKRTALSVYPRTQVAGLSGKDWFHFLNSSTRKPLFTESMITSMEYISYANKDMNVIDPQMASDLFTASSRWIKHHRMAVGSENP